MFRSRRGGLSVNAAAGVDNQPLRIAWDGAEDLDPAALHGEPVLGRVAPRGPK